MELLRSREYVGA